MCIYSHIYAHYKCNVKQEKAHTKKYMPCTSIYKTKNRHYQTTMLEVRKLDSSGELCLEASIKGTSGVVVM